MEDMNRMKLKKFSGKLRRANVLKAIAIILLVCLYNRQQHQFFIIVNGSSMEPTLKNHSLVYVNHDFKSIEKEDIIVANWNNETIVKRVVGVAGDKYVASLFGDSFTLITQESQSSLNFKPSTNLILSTIPTGYYFVEGDNIDTSYDSQDFGLIPRSHIIAKVIL